MSLFVVDNIRPLKFHLLGLTKSKYDKYKKLITDNGGEVSVIGGYPVINFSMPGCFPNDEVVFNVCYIEECIKENRILDLVDFNISEENDYQGCALSYLLFGNPRCKLAVASVPSAMLENNDKNGDNNCECTKYNSSLHKEKTIEKRSIYQLASSSTDVHNSNVIITEHKNKGSISNLDKGCKHKVEEIHEIKGPNISQSNKKSNSSCSYISPRTSQSKLPDEVNMISDDELEIAAKSSSPQALNSVSLDIITNDDTDENEVKLLIEDDNSFITSSYERRSEKENDSNETVVNNTTDDSSDNLKNMRTSFSSKKFLNLRPKKT